MKFYLAAHIMVRAHLSYKITACVRHIVVYQYSEFIGSCKALPKHSNTVNHVGCITCVGCIAILIPTKHSCIVFCCFQHSNVDRVDGNHNLSVHIHRYHFCKSTILVIRHGFPLVCKLMCHVKHVRIVGDEVIPADIVHLSCDTDVVDVRI